jgi:hypothetical protein
VAKEALSRSGAAGSKRDRASGPCLYDWLLQWAARMGDRLVSDRSEAP